VRSWASDTLLGGTRRGVLLRVGLAVGLLAVAFWALPTRRADDGAGHHGGHAPALDAFERAGVTEFTEDQRGPGLRLARFPDGAAVSLEAFADKLVLLNFWATWCTPCTVEMPFRNLRPKRLGLIIIRSSVDLWRAGRLRPRRNRLSFDPAGPRQPAAGAWRVTGIPTTFVVRPGGEVAGMAAGAREWNSAEMRALIEPLLPHRIRVP
jgi:hypothetical protein